MFVFNSFDAKQSKCNCLPGFTCPICNPAEPLKLKSTKEELIAQEEPSRTLPMPEAPQQNSINIINYNGSYCSYSCGAYGEPELLQEHEMVCPKKVINVLCLIDQCDWKGPNDSLIKHVCEFHFKDLIVIYPSRKTDFPLKFTGSYKLLTMFPKSYPFNQLYWMRLYEQDNEMYFMVQYLGHVGQRKVFKGPEQYVLTVGRISYTLNIEEFNQDEQKSIINNLFMTANGLKLSKSFMEEFEYFFTLKGISIEPSKEKINDILRCITCKKLRRPPFTGSVKHCGLCDTSFSTQSVSFQVNKSSPKITFMPIPPPIMVPAHQEVATKKPEEDDWKYLLKSLSLNVEYNCEYYKNGCLEFVTEQNTHEAVCPFRTVRCWICSVQESSEKMISHIQGGCSSKALKNDSIIKICIDDKVETKKYLLIAFEHLFGINIETFGDDKVIKVMFTQLVNPLYDDFWVNVQVIGDGITVLNTLVSCRPTVACYFDKNFKDMEMKVSLFKLLQKST